MERYEPQTPAAIDNVQDLLSFVLEENRRISAAMKALLPSTLETSSTVPKKPRDGTFAYADGVNWNPGGGPGPYVYINGSWVSLKPESGMIFDYGGTVAPAGYLLCDGSNQTRTGVTASLFAAIGTNWGVGDGATTFGIPDLRRRVTVGKGGTGTTTIGNAVGNVGGEEAHALTTAELAVHAHNVAGTTAGDDRDHQHWEALVQVIEGPYPYGGPGPFITGTAGSATDNHYSQATSGITTGHLHGFNVNSGNAGSGTAHNTMQPSAIVTKLIKI